MYSQWSSSYFMRVMVMQLSKYTLHNLAIPWENINNDTLNTSGVKCYNGISVRLRILL